MAMSEKLTMKEKGLLSDLVNEIKSVDGLREKLHVASYLIGEIECSLGCDVMFFTVAHHNATHNAINRLGDFDRDLSVLGRVTNQIDGDFGAVADEVNNIIINEVYERVSIDMSEKSKRLSLLVNEILESSGVNDGDHLKGGNNDNLDS